MTDTADPRADVGERIPAPALAAAYPAGFAQRRLWFLAQLHPGDTAYHVPLALRLEGPLDVAALRRALDELVRRHGALRTVLHAVDGEPVQVVHAPAPVPLPVQALDAADRAQPGSGALGEAVRAPFDLARGPLFRPSLWVEREDRHLLLLSMHHAVTDGWSLGVIAHELGALYAAYADGRPSPLPEPPLQYADFAAWQRDRMRGEGLESELGYWRAHLAALPPAGEQPRPWPPAGAGADGRVPAGVDGPARRRVDALARSLGATPFMVMLAGWMALLHRHTGRGDVAVCTPVANRPAAETETVVGCFANLVVVRASLADDPTFAALVERVREGVLGALAHAEAPFEAVVEALRPGRSLERRPLADTCFVLQGAPPPAPAFGALGAEPVALHPAGAKWDLTLELWPGERGTGGWLEHDGRVLDAAAAAGLAARYRRLLDAAVEAPNERVSGLELLEPAERHAVLAGWSGGAAPAGPFAPVHRQVREQARRTPEALALVRGGEAWSYARLLREADAVAARLRDAGVRRGDVVAVSAARRLPALAALLGILERGAAFLPLDPAYPEARRRFILRDAGASLLLTDRPGGVTEDGVREMALADGGASGSDETGGIGGSDPVDGMDPIESAGERDLAYVLYTSGSTGMPKGVEVEHGGVCNLVRWAGEHFGDRLARVALTTSLGFDVSMFELFAPLCAGGTVVLADDLLSIPPDAVPTLVSGVPSGMEALLRLGALPPTARTLVLAGEPLRRSLADELAATGAEVVDLYGPTEATVYATGGRRAAGEAETIGRPLAGTRAYVLDERLRPVAPGFAGELYLGGAGVARGYRGRPALTAARFVPDPFAGAPGARLYRTGDLARHRADGRLQFLGRADQQVKVRGFRIEPGEIEAVLAAHPGVRAATVHVREGDGGPRLVAYVETGGGAAPDADALAQACRDRLPVWMVPDAFVALDALPRTASGKVDRGALPAPGGRAGAGVPPRSPLEQVVASVFQDVLRSGSLGAHDDFFALGGHSLLAAQAVARLRRVLEVELPLSAVFEAPTPAALAARARGAPAALAPAIPAADEEDGTAPASFAQEHFWIAGQVGGSGTAYHLAGRWRIHGPVRVDALARALARLGERHETLRTTFEPRGGGVMQRIHPTPAFALEVEDLAADRVDGAAVEGTADGVDEMEEALERRTAEEARRPFDLRAGPLLRARLFRLGGDRHALLLVAHHVAADDWSLGILLDELGRLYAAELRGEPAALQPLPMRHADLARSERARWAAPAQAGRRGELVAYWRERLAAAPPLRLGETPLPPDAPGSTLHFHLPPALGAALRALAVREGATPFMVLLAGFGALLHRYTGEEAFSLGSPVTRRNGPEMEGVVGPLLHTLALAVECADDPSFAALVGRVRRSALGAFAHGDLPFEALPELRGGMPAGAAFPVFFSQRDLAPAALRLEGAETRPEPVELGAARAELTLLVRPQTDGGVECALEFRHGVLTEAQAGRMAEHYRVLLESAAARPDLPLGALDVLPPAERERLLVEWNPPAPPLAEGEDTLHGSFERQAARTPHLQAVHDGRRALTYAALDRRAGAIAARLAAAGVRPEEPVGVCAGRTVDLVAALLGVMKAGAAWVPLDPVYPRARLEQLLAATGARILLHDDAAPEGLPAALPIALGEIGAGDDPPPARVHGRSLAYILATSGSTGVPKCVGIEHHSAAGFIRWATESYDRQELAQVFASTSICFDPCVFEIFATLAVGGRVIVGRDVLALPTHPLRDVVTLVNTVPSAGRELLRAGGFPEGAGTVNLVGEPLSTELVAAVLALPGVRRVVDMYGPTETTTYATAVDRDPHAPPTVGRPVAGATAYVLDAGMRLLPAGVAGELYLGGPGVARGYVGAPARTAERFVPHPFGGPGEVVYRTGDRARFRDDGQIEVLGRIDRQVKVRGFRIEPGEVEQVLRAHPAVGDAAVEASARAGALVAFVSPSPDGPAVDVAELRAWVAARLPAFMVPGRVEVLDRLPRLPNEKLDRTDLRRRASRPAQEAADEAGPAPRTELEHAIAGVWRETLSLAEVGVDQNFFELGGSSVVLSRVYLRLQEVLGRPLEMVDLFRHPTVARLARHLSAGAPVPAADEAPAEARRTGLQDQRALRLARRGGSPPADH
jgi:amino acid adenylation domain-containing protein